MDIDLAVAVTDGDWFEMLRQQPNLCRHGFQETAGITSALGCQTGR
jgi:hypothetical protein